MKNFKTYQFKTITTMKEYNSKNWWIDSGVVREIIVNADDIDNALSQYRDIVSDKCYIDISKNALNNKRPMYRDMPDGEVAQSGYVITGKTDFQTETGGWVRHYVDLWVSVSIILNPFEEV